MGLSLAWRSGTWLGQAASGPTQVPWQGEQQSLRPGWQPPRHVPWREGKGRVIPDPAQPCKQECAGAEGSRSLCGQDQALHRALLGWCRMGGSCSKTLESAQPASPTAPLPQHKPTAQQDPQHSPDTVNTSQRRSPAFLSFPAGLEGDLASATPSSQLTFLAPHFPVQSRA